MRLRPLEPAPLIHPSLDETPAGLERIHLYFCDLDVEGQSGRWDESALSAQERQQADRRRDSHRLRFITGRVILRTLLSRVLGQDLRQIVLKHNAFGKPVLAAQASTVGRGSGLHFNVSHREQVLMIGLTALGELGVDVELVQPIADLDQFASDHLAAPQARALQAMPPDRKLEELYRAWTLKEAMVKAVGTCIALGVEAEAAGLPEKCLACRARNFRSPGESAMLFWQQGVTVGESNAMACAVLVAR